MATLQRRKEKHKVISLPKKPKNFTASISKINSVTVRIRKIGNSKGILLSNSIISKSGIEDNAEVIVTAEKGMIMIKPSKNKRKINTNLSTWESQFKAAIKNGDKPEADMFEGMGNKFDKQEW